MPKFVGLLQGEISRLARREVTKSQKSLKKTAAAAKKENADLKKRVKSLETAVKMLQKSKGIGTPQTESKKKLLAFKKLSRSEVKKMLNELKAKKVKTTAAPAKK